MAYFRTVFLALSLLFVLCLATESEDYDIIEDVLKGADHYAVLQISEDATASEVKKAFHKLSMKYHPDKIKKGEQTEETEQFFLQIARAYEVLSSPTQREIYDHFRIHGVPWEKRYYGRWVHYYGAPAHDLRTVLMITIIAATAIHFFLKKQRYKRVVRYVKSKEVYKQRASVIKSQCNVDDVKVELSGLKEPTWKDLLPVSITIWLWKFVSYWVWYIVWILILRQPYDREAELLKKLNMTKEEYEEAKEKYVERMKQYKTSNKAKKARRMMRRYQAGLPLR